MVHFILNSGKPLRKLLRSDRYWQVSLILEMSTACAQWFLQCMTALNFSSSSIGQIKECFPFLKLLLPLLIRKWYVFFEFWWWFTYLNNFDSFQLLLLLQVKKTKTLTSITHAHTCSHPNNLINWRPQGFCHGLILKHEQLQCVVYFIQWTKVFYF